MLLAALPAGAQTALPDGEGKDTVATLCTTCHEINRVTNAGYSLADWRNNLHMMINVGAPLPQDQVDTVARYLAANFPEKPKPAAAVVPGGLAVSIREWVVPTPGVATARPARRP